MKICRFNQRSIGLVVEDSVYDLTELAPQSAPVDLVWIAARFADRSSAELEHELRGCRRIPLNSIRLDSPIRAAGKIVAAPVNYHAHVAEMQINGQSHGHGLKGIREAGLFLKASSSIVGPEDGIAIRFPDRRTDFELEVCAVIGQTTSNAKSADALKSVLGFCLGLDITLRGPEDRSFRKSIDSYTVLGPWLTTLDEVGSVADVGLQLTQNGVVRQAGSTADMIMNFAELIEFASSFYSLHPGDVLMSGTPDGVGPIRSGDVLVATSSELGSMTTLVRAAAA